jgi:hypothetical protein
MLIVLLSHSSVFAHLLAADEAMNHVEVLIRKLHIRALSDEERFRAIYREVAREVPACGNMVPDIHTWRLFCDSMG